jgi:hypothetical protein
MTNLFLLGDHFRIGEKLVELQVNESKMSGNVLGLGGSELALAARQRRIEGVDDSLVSTLYNFFLRH